MAFELRPVPIEDVLTGIEVGAELLEVLAMEDLEDVWPADCAKLILDPVFEFDQLFRVRLGAASEQAIEGSHHVVAR